MVEFKGVITGYCEGCYEDEVLINEDGICEECFEALIGDPKLGLLVELGYCNSKEVLEMIVSGNEYYNLSNNYLVLTEEEVNERNREYIGETLWAFNSSFLSDQTELPQEVFKCMQDQCEGSNDAIESIIEKTCGMDEFVKAAVGADGHEAFLGEERSLLDDYVEYDGEHYYVFE